MNDAAVDDEDDDDMDSYHNGPTAGPHSSPDLIAGMRKAAQQECVSYEDGHDININTNAISETQLPAESCQKELCQETWVCSAADCLRMQY